MCCAAGRVGTGLILTKSAFNALDALGLLTPAVAPLAMILLGAILALHPVSLHHRWRSSLIVIVVRLLLVPGLILWLARTWFDASPLFLLVLMVEVATPPATNLSIIAVRYGDQAGHVSSVLLTTYLTSVLTLPMWIGIVGLG